MLITPTPAGDLRYKLTIINVGPGIINELGETTPTSTPIRTIWCKITPLSGTERYVNAQNTANVTHEIRTRYVPYLDHTSKLTLNNRTFDLVSVLDIESQHIELLILAQEVRP
jgi:SPP1 family predicted phage head-tail adaptor